MKHTDKEEGEYKALAEKLGKEPTASNMVGFDILRASCRIVAEKILDR